MNYVNSTAPDADKRRPVIRIKVSALIENFRQQHSGAGVVQNQVYQEKLEQATDFAVSNFIDDVENFPLLLVEASARGTTVQYVAESIIAKRQRWNAMITSTEFIAITSAIAIDLANTIEELELVLNETQRHLHELDY